MRPSRPTRARGRLAARRCHRSRTRTTISRRSRCSWTASTRGIATASSKTCARTSGGLAPCRRRFSCSKRLRRRGSRPRPPRAAHLHQSGAIRRRPSVGTPRARLTSRSHRTRRPASSVVRHQTRPSTRQSCPPPPLQYRHRSCRQVTRLLECRLRGRRLRPSRELDRDPCYSLRPACHRLALESCNPQRSPASRPFLRVQTRRRLSKTLLQAHHSRYLHLPAA